MKILTFDIEEWFHILDNECTKIEKDWMCYEDRLIANVERILIFLSETRLNATFFCLGWIARRYPTVIKRISALGYEIGSHSDMHQLVYEQKKAHFKNDITKSIESIEDITGKKVRIYRAPGFSIKEENLWALEIILESGIEIDSSVFPSRRAHGGFRNFGPAEPALIDIRGQMLKEFPISMWRFAGHCIPFSGGGYFRLFPYTLIKNFMTNSSYVMTYFHPRDFDPDQPVIHDLTLFKKFKSYYGLKGAFRKLTKLALEFNWVDLKDADDLVEWNKARVIHLNHHSG